MDAFLAPPAPLQFRANHIPQFDHPTANPCLDGPEGLAKVIGDFRLGHRREKGQLNDLTLIIRELFNGLADQFTRLRRGDRIERTPVVKLLEDLRFVLNVLLQPAAPLAEPVCSRRCC